MRGSRSVVVVGSGAAGLAAALSASATGADVLVLEASAWLGGTTAMSGGVVWMPGHGRGSGGSARPGCDGHDDTAEALSYLQAASPGTIDVDLVRAFLSDTRRVVDEIERRTAICWEVLAHWPDYRGELPGAHLGGRSLWPRPLELPRHVEHLVHPAMDQPTPALEAGAPANDGVVLRGHVRGRALAGGLLAAVLDAGVEVRTGASVECLVTEGGAVTGVMVGGAVEPGTVVLATGGFQHDAVLVAEHLPGAPLAPMGPSWCRGDGLRMAHELGAELANLHEGWWMPAMHAPGESVDNVTHFRPLHSERAQPGSIMVDRTGRRFVDEAQNYGDVGRAMRRPPPAATGTGGTVERGAPWWLILDDGYRRRYPLGPLGPGDPDPEWLYRADNVESLAGRIGVPRDALVDAVALFNAGAARGEDAEFGRGTRPYDRWIGDHHAAHPTLAPLAEAPFYALEVRLGCMGTKGGPRTDAHGRVLLDSTPSAYVPGLFAAGNAAASPFGSATVAGGATLGPALVFGYRAGEAAAGGGR